MKRLTNKTNIDNSDANYPFGKSVDETGTNNGTPVNFERLNDWDQFFEKIFEESGLTANGLPDNASDGYQLYEAFRLMTRPYKVYAVNISQSGTTAPVPTEFQNELGIDPSDYNYSSTGQYTIDKVGAFVTNKTFVMINQSGGTSVDIRAQVISADQIVITSAAGGTATNGTIGECSLEIRVYD